MALQRALFAVSSYRPPNGQNQNSLSGPGTKYHIKLTYDHLAESGLQYCEIHLFTKGGRCSRLFL